MDAIAKREITQAEIAGLVALFDSVVEHLQNLGKRSDPDRGGTVQPGRLSLEIVLPENIESLKDAFRKFVPEYRQREAMRLRDRINARIREMNGTSGQTVERGAE